MVWMNDVLVPAGESHGQSFVSRSNEDRSILALWEETRERERTARTIRRCSLLMLPLCLKNALVIGVIHDHKPPSTSLAI
jgi:hypothetical protein